MSVHSFPSERSRRPAESQARPEGADRLERVLAVGLIAVLAIQALLVIAGWLGG